MSKILQDDMYDFLQLVARNVHEGRAYHDAIDLAAISIGGVIPAIVSQATSKYQEATNSRTDLAQQENIDTLAFMSMDELWHSDTYTSNANISLDLKDILAQAIYLVLKYCKTDNVLEINRQLPGAQEARESMIHLVYTS